MIEEGKELVSRSTVCYKSLHDAMVCSLISQGENTSSIDSDDVLEFALDLQIGKVAHYLGIAPSSINKSSIERQQIFE